MNWSAIILVLIFLLVIFAPFIAPVDPFLTNPEMQLQSPQPSYILGTDYLGRDVLSRVLFGGQRTLGMATAATLVSISIGTLIGLITGSAGERIDWFVTTILNALLAFPSMVLALLMITVLGQGFGTVILVVGLSQVANCARIVRSGVLTVRQMDYILAAQAIGASPVRVVLYHILPNIRSLLLAFTGIVFSYSILMGAALSFLGFAGEPGIPDWGVMLVEGRTAFRYAPWVAIAPGIMITLTIISIHNLLDYYSSSNLST